MTGVLIRGGFGHRHTRGEHVEREAGQVRTDTKIGEMCLHAKGHQGTGATLETGRAGSILPESRCREHSAADTLILDFWPPEHDRIDFCCVRPLGMWGLLEQPRK